MIIADTIFALSSGTPPAGIAVVRISGRLAGGALELLTGRALPKPRIASLRKFKDPDTQLIIDQGLTLWFPGPATATGEDLVELHLHGGRAVIAAMLQALSEMDGLRPADAGEFTRRAFLNGHIDLAEAEGLADLLAAETEAQRRSAIAQVGGSLHRLTQNWAKQLLELSATIEAIIDFSDEDDVQSAIVPDLRMPIDVLLSDMKQRLADPPAERLHEGLRVAIIGPPNSGKSTLFNRLIDRDAAIVSDIAGTTRDVIEAPVRLAGLPLIMIDTAGIRQDSADPIEVIGVERSIIESESADVVLALGGWRPTSSSAFTINVFAKSDLTGHHEDKVSVSARTGHGIDALKQAIVSAAKAMLPVGNQVALNSRHRAALREAITTLEEIEPNCPELIIAEHLRVARTAIGKITGGTDTEDMLDTLFGSFCIGK